MSETNFAPGPWEYIDEGDISEDGEDWAILDRNHESVAYAIEEEDALLITSAPVMYELLERVIREYELSGGPHTLTNDILKELANARGEHNDRD